MAVFHWLGAAHTELQMDQELRCLCFVLEQPVSQIL